MSIEESRRIIISQRVIVAGKSDVVENLVRCTCGNKDQSRFLSCAHEGEIVCKGNSIVG